MIFGIHGHGDGDDDSADDDDDGIREISIRGGRRVGGAGGDETGEYSKGRYSTGGTGTGLKWTGLHGMGRDRTELEGSRQADFKRDIA